MAAALAVLSLAGVGLAPVDAHADLSYAHQEGFFEGSQVDEICGGGCTPFVNPVFDQGVFPGPSDDLALVVDAEEPVFPGDPFTHYELATHHAPAVFVMAALARVEPDGPYPSNTLADTNAQQRLSVAEPTTVHVTGTLAVTSDNEVLGTYVYSRFRFCTFPTASCGALATVSITPPAPAPGLVTVIEPIDFVLELQPGTTYGTQADLRALGIGAEAKVDVMVSVVPEAPGSSGPLLLVLAGVLTGSGFRMAS